MGTAGRIPLRGLGEIGVPFLTAFEMSARWSLALVAGVIVRFRGSGIWSLRLGRIILHRRLLAFGSQRPA